jgi:hypothetical protein
MPLFKRESDYARIERCGLFIKLPPFMSALSTVIRAGLFVSRSDGLKHCAVSTLRAGLPDYVCGLAVGGRHDNVWTLRAGLPDYVCGLAVGGRHDNVWTPVGTSALPADGLTKTPRTPKSTEPAMSKTDQQNSLSFSIMARSDISHLVLGGSMLGYGLVGTIVVVLLIVFLVRGL